MELNKDALLGKLASEVKRRRLEKGVSQESASTDTGIHFGRIEQGKRDISFTTLRKLCDYFGISMGDFLNEF